MIGDSLGDIKDAGIDILFIEITLVFLINVPRRLLIFQKFSTQEVLIRDRTFIRFWDFFQEVKIYFYQNKNKIYSFCQITVKLENCHVSETKSHWTLLRLFNKNSNQDVY